MYTNVELLCYPPETNIILYVNYISIKNKTLELGGSHTSGCTRSCSTKHALCMHHMGSEFGSPAPSELFYCSLKFSLSLDPSCAYFWPLLDFPMYEAPNALVSSKIAFAFPCPTVTAKANNFQEIILEIASGWFPSGKRGKAVFPLSFYNWTSLSQALNSGHTGIKSRMFALPHDDFII